MTDPELTDTKPRSLKPKSASATEAKLSDTRPRRVKPIPSSPPSSRIPKYFLIAALVALFLSLAVGSGALAGFQSARRALQTQKIDQTYRSLDEQFILAQEDQAAGRFEIARQRYEYILTQNPAYPAAADRLAEVMAILFATATPTTLPPTSTATPTRDLRPVEDLFKQARAQFSSQDWSGAIDTLTSLRQADAMYEVTRVDGMLYLALRQRGILKILHEANLAGGIYDLALAEAFGPLDVEANNARGWARLYMIGLSFWDVDPENAVYYFGQLAAAAPGLSDVDGWTANERYRVALIQYGDLLASQNNWCDAMQQYELSMAIAQGTEVTEKYKTASQQCLGVSPTPTGSVVFTSTPTFTMPPNITPTFTLPPYLTPTVTFTPPPVIPTATFTSPPPIDTTTPTETPPLPTDTSPPPVEPTAAETTQPLASRRDASSSSPAPLQVLLAGLLSLLVLWVKK
jgi:hypothetical protein